MANRYLTNTITNVILRIDFANPISSINSELHSSVRSECLKYFEIPEIKEAHNQEIQFSGHPGNQSVALNSSSITEWHFKGKSSRKELTVTQNSILISVQDYISFDLLKHEFIAIYKAFRDIYGDAQISRMGLRYVDQIEPETKKTTEETWGDYWESYVDKNLLGGLSFANADEHMARQMSVCELNFGEYSLTFQYGMYNPDYPAVAKKSVFVLDTDVYSAGLFNYDDAIGYLDSFHEHASQWFEHSITDNFRRILGVAKDE